MNFRHITGDDEVYVYYNGIHTGVTIGRDEARTLDRRMLESIAALIGRSEDARSLEKMKAEILGKFPPEEPS